VLPTQQLSGIRRLRHESQHPCNGRAELKSVRAIIIGGVSTGMATLLNGMFELIKVYTRKTNMRRVIGRSRFLYDPTVPMHFGGPHLRTTKHVGCAKGSILLNFNELRDRWLQSCQPSEREYDVGNFQNVSHFCRVRTNAGKLTGMLCDVFFRSLLIVVGNWEKLEVWPG
jgi:hypothetical protein